MMISKKAFVEKVAYAINANEIALFVAAGLSASTGQKNWAQMLTPCANALELNITVRQSRQSGVARATCPD